MRTGVHGKRAADSEGGAGCLRIDQEARVE